MSTAQQPVARRDEPYQLVAKRLEAAMPQIAKALPKHLSQERMARMALNSIRLNEKLAACNPLSILNAVATAAQVGLELGGPLGQAWLIPYGQECALQLGYKGVLALALRTGRIAGIDAECVHDCDLFDYRLGDDAKIVHEPAWSDPGRDEKPITAVYAIVRLRGGAVIRKVMSRAEIEKHAQRYSQALKGRKKDSPWLDPLGWRWMAKKTVLLQALKLVELSPEDRSLIETTESRVYELAREEESSSMAPRGLQTLDALAEQPTPKISGATVLDAESDDPPADRSDARAQLGRYVLELARAMTTKDVGDIEAKGLIDPKLDAEAKDELQRACREQTLLIQEAASKER